jgi:hypothetical protein
MIDDSNWCVQALTFLAMAPAFTRGLMVEVISLTLLFAIGHTGLTLDKKDQSAAVNEVFSIIARDPRVIFAVVLAEQCRLSCLAAQRLDQALSLLSIVFCSCSRA